MRDFTVERLLGLRRHEILDRLCGDRYGSSRRRSDFRKLVDLATSSATPASLLVELLKIRTVSFLAKRAGAPYWPAEALARLDREELLFELVRRTNPMTPQALEQAYALGMLRLTELVDGIYYRGSCRNAQVARWQSEKGCFIHMRDKMGLVYPEEIPHPENDRGWDVFVPVEACEPAQVERIVPKYEYDFSRWRGF